MTSIKHSWYLDFVSSSLQRGWSNTKPWDHDILRFHSSLFYYTLLCGRVHMDIDIMKQRLGGSMAKYVLTIYLKPRGPTNFFIHFHMIRPLEVVTISRRYVIVYYKHEIRVEQHSTYWNYHKWENLGCPTYCILKWSPSLIVIGSTLVLSWATLLAILN